MAQKISAINKKPCFNILVLCATNYTRSLTGPKNRNEKVIM